MFNKGRFVRLIVMVMLLPGLSGCAGFPTSPASSGQPSSSVVAALPASRQDKTVQPRLVFLPRDNAFATWWTGVVSDGWIGAGQHYAGSQGMAARVDYYSQDGQLRWSYRGAASGSNSACYLCATRRADGALIVGGRFSDGTNPDQGSVTAFGPGGEILWTTLIDYPTDVNLGLTAAHCLITADDRILVILDTTLYNAATGTQPSLVTCLDATGRQLWQVKLDFGGMTYGHQAVLAEDNGIYLAVYGFARSGNQLSTEYNWLVRLDRTGKEVWRLSLADASYQYQAASLARDNDGHLYLSCSARYIGATPTPTMPAAKTAEFHDRYRSLAWNPAALLKIDSAGRIEWTKLLNGEFGASGGQVFCDQKTVYWRATLVDDIVPPYIFMSVDHRSVTHEVLALLGAAAKDFSYCQFSQTESGDQLVQRIENGQPVLIGVEPFIPPPEWATETFIPGQG